MSSTRLQVRAAPAAAAPPSGPQVFISYSSKDRKLVEEFVRQLKPLQEAMAVDVFFDRAGLVAGDAWAPIIEAALDRCTLFLLFVSSNSLASEFCIKRELLVALDRRARGLCTVVPIILTACPWPYARLPVGGGTLEQFQVLPEGRQPVSDGDGGPAARARVWTRIVDALAPLLDPARGDAAEVAVNSAATAGTPTRLNPVPALLPYLCDQQPPDWAIHQLLRQWQAQPVPLVLVMRGLEHDCPDKFAERIVERRLNRLLDKIAPGFGVQRHLGLQWPMPSLKLDGPQLEAFFLGQLAERVMEDDFADEAQLVAHLNDSKLHRLFLVGLPREDTGYLMRSTRALASCLGRLAPQLAPRRIACLLWSEDPAFKQAEPAAEWIADGTGALIGVPSPLMVFDMDDVRQWASLEEVQRVKRLERDVIDEAFRDKPAELTMHEFVRTITPVLRRAD